ncbi:MAG: protein phosphatase CheZ [Pseudomonadota bacterium]|nr:protein phosphatase CheZ [Pseudomonadota bacterium]
MTDAADDFDALFDQVSAQRDASTPVAPVAQVVAAAPPAAAEDDFDALFDQVAAANPVSAPLPVVVAAGLAAAAAPEPAADEHAGSAADKPMFERLGGIVRLLHDSLRELGYDKALTEASTQINDAQDRLEYVASLTEQAANKVLNTLDDGMPAQDVLSKHAKRMETRWAELFAGKLSIDEFKALAGDSQQFAQAVAAATEAEKARLLDIMMAQDFQDITGQLIKKVVAITKTVEHELAELLRDNAPPAVREKLAAKPVALMAGPALPSIALDQDNVDDLLADLGF